MRDLWVPVSGAIAQQKRVETIANNVANANTAGFKRDQMVFGTKPNMDPPSEAKREAINGVTFMRR